jgi:hypothetical protein
MRLIALVAAVAFTVVGIAGPASAHHGGNSFDPCGTFTVCL